MNDKKFTKLMKDIGLINESMEVQLGKIRTDKDFPPFKTPQQIKEEELVEGKRWEVYIQGEREPFVIGGKNEKDVKKLAHQMTYPARIKITKIKRA